MSNTTVVKPKLPTEYDVEMARKELYAQLAEAAKYSDEEGTDVDEFFKKLLTELNEKV